MEAAALLYDLNTTYGLALREDPAATPGRNPRQASAKDPVATPGPAAGLTIDQLETLLAARIHELINGDFNALIGLLYRIDVSEQRLRRLLQENPEGDAGRIIARLVLERQWQKILTRRQFQAGAKDQSADNEESEEERWDG